MRIGDQTIRDALKKAQAVLCQYLEPDGPNEYQTVKRLFGILNDPDVTRALEDSERPRGRRVSGAEGQRLESGEEHCPPSRGCSIG
jgi:hypothetical protein